MIAIAVISAFAVMFAAAERLKNGTGGLKVSFIIIFAFLSIRFDFGNDYQAYLDGYVDINNLTFVDYFNSDLHFEPGWVFLCRIFKPFGFFCMVAVLAAFNCIVYFRFISKHVPKSYYWLAVFFYTFNPGMMLIHASAMRQSVAIAFLLIAYDALIKKRVVPYFLLVGLGATFHSSSLLLAPLGVLAFFEFQFSKNSVFVVFAIFFSIFFAGEWLGSLLTVFIDANFSRYSVYEGGLKLGSGLGLAVDIVFFILVLHASIGQNRQQTMLYLMAILNYIFIPMVLVILHFSRIVMYFQPMLFAAYCLVVRNVRSTIIRSGLIVLFVSYTFNAYFVFFQSDIFGPHFSVYKTVFSAPRYY